MPTNRHALSPLLVIALAACGGSDGASPTDTADSAGDTTVADTVAPDTTPADSAADTTPADTSPAGASVSFQFVDPIGGPGVPDVSVAWIAPGGARIETTSDTNGRVVFHGIDWSKGKATLTGLKAGRVVHSGVMDEHDLNDPAIIRNADGDIVVDMPPLDGPPRITVRGVATGMQDDGHNLVVGADAVNTPLSVRRGPNFELSVPPDTAFNWSAFEWGPNGQSNDPRVIDNNINQWAAGASPGGSADYTLDVDFAGQSMIPSAVEGTLKLFSSDRSSLDESGVLRVSLFAHSQTLSGFVGATSYSSIADDGTVDYKIEWIEPEWADTPAVMFNLSSQSESSQVAVHGLPSAGSQDISLPIPASWNAATTGAHPIDEALSWSDEEPGMLVTIAIYFGTGPNAALGWIVSLPAGTTELTLPELPGGYDLFEDGGLGLISAAVFLCELDPEVSDTQCARWATSKRLSIGPAAP